MLYLIGLYMAVVVGLCITIVTPKKYKIACWGYWVGLLISTVLSVACYPYRLARITGELSSLFIR